MIYIVIPVHNRKHFTRQCLVSLQSQTSKNFRVIIVDDGSTDGTEEMVRDEFPEVILLKGDGNLWWTGSINLGISWVINNRPNFEVILLLNDDLDAKKDYIEKLVLHYKNKPDIIMGSINYDIISKKIFSAGKIRNWILAKDVSLTDIYPLHHLNGLKEVTHFCGRGLWIPRKVFESIGLFDARNFPHYASDEEYTFRASKNGFKIYCNCDAIIYSNNNLTGETQFITNVSFSNFIRYLSNIKSGGNLKNRIKLATRHCPLKYLATYIIIDTLRVIGGYFKKHYEIKRQYNA